MEKTDTQADKKEDDDWFYMHQSLDSIHEAYVRSIQPEIQALIVAANEKLVRSTTPARPIPARANKHEHPDTPAPSPIDGGGIVSYEDHEIKDKL